MEHGGTHKEHGEMVERSSAGMPDERTLDDISDFFRMFSDSTRIKILWALEGGEMGVCCIADALGMTVSAVSHQLRKLRDARLIKSRKDGRNVFYSLDDDHVEGILDMAYEHIME
ncbi:MAG: helix-turn-helix transcriptional regulator [Thermoplasmatales archaeon]|nr:helix-turn-helix transcriptional regulator [Thermoplasmatales archaeon]